MGLLNLLTTNDIAVNGFWQTFDVSLNWIGNLIRLLISGIGVVGIGIIVFSLILKLITLPLDVYQRISMRKQNIKMKENKEKMEKLQKQYANNKELYNQKVMEMYKESGISIFSSCLPMIVSLVIFIVAINAFNAYSQYANIQNYNTMVQAYNAKLNEYCVDLNGETLTINDKGDYIVVNDADPYNYIYYTVKDDGTFAAKDAAAQKAYVKDAKQKTYYINVAKVEAQAEKDTEMGNAITALVDTTNADAVAARKDAIHSYFKGIAQEAVVAVYNTKVTKDMGFLWIKNIWATDASYKSPVMDYASFEAAAKQESFEVAGVGEVEYVDISAHTINGNPYDSGVYEIVTAKLTTQKDQANGYYILIVLSIGTILLQQFVMMRSQKEQQKYSSVDGQGASQQKMMMIIMTGMFAIFSFMYSSAFSIYLITSNIFSMISTFIINKSVDVREAKKAAKAAEVRLDKRASGRLEAAQNAGRSSAKASREKKSSKTDTTEKTPSNGKNK